MIIVTTENIPGKEIKEVFGFVSASTVRTKNIGKDIGAGFKTLVGGEIKAYQEMMEESRKIAIGRMVEKAEEYLTEIVGKEKNYRLKDFM